MKVFKFSKLLGTVYRRGNVLLTPDGFTAISPVGNRVTFYDLKNNVSETLPVELSSNITAVALSPNGLILIAATELGEVHVISLKAKTSIHCLKVGKNVSCIEFSPNGEHFAIAKEGTVFVYNAPVAKRCFNPFVMEKLFNVGDSKHPVTCISWSFDSRFFAAGSDDMMIRMCPLQKFSNFRSSSFTGHSDAVVECSFAHKSYQFYSVSRNGQLCIWDCSHEPNEFVLDLGKPMRSRALVDDDIEEKSKENEDGDELKQQSEALESIRFRKTSRHFYSDLFKKGIRTPALTCADFCVRNTVTVVTGFEDGSFFIHLLPEFEIVTSLNISNQSISTITLNSNSFFIAVGCADLGQLLVWEWPSETYVMKQQGHLALMNAIDFSPDGRYVVTGGEDAKVKVWDLVSSFCFVTFNEHKAGVADVVFTQNGKAVISASLDGTVRAFDLTRYRNFRTFTSPKPVQFSCLSVDASREFVAAGGQDVFDIFIWSISTGRLLEVLSGHEGPVSRITFSPSLGSMTLASVSWDKTLRIWDSIESSSSREIVQLYVEGTSLAFRPDGKEIAVGTLDCQISFFDASTAVQQGSIEGRNHLGAARTSTDIVTAKKNLESQAFTSLCYSADGGSLLAAGRSKNICEYDANTKVLIQKYHITKNRSLHGMNQYLNHRTLTDFGIVNNIELRDDEDADKLNLPGARKGNMAARSFTDEVKIQAVKFSSTGRIWGAASTEGLLIYSTDVDFVFAPINLDENLTPRAIRAEIRDTKFDTALIMALRLNITEHIREVLEQVPVTHIQAVCQALPKESVDLILKFLSAEVGTSRHMQFYVKWVQTLLKCHLPSLKAASQKYKPALSNLERNILRRHEEILSLSSHNKYLLRYLLVSSTAEGMAEDDASEKTEESDDELTDSDNVDNSDMSD